LEYRHGLSLCIAVVLDFPYLPEIGSPFFPCRRWRLLDPHALPPPVKPGKSRQIVASETADPRASDQTTIFADVTDVPR
jgi:hypothetical protein